MKVERNGMKKNFTNKIIIIILMATAAFLIGCEKTAEKKEYAVKEENVIEKNKNEYHLRQGELVFYGNDKREITRIAIEIASDDYSRSFGLMFRKKLPFSQGMLFIFNDDDIRYFWMKNTPLPLDMIFIDKDKKIVKIRKNTKPFTLQSYSSVLPARYVVEVNAGFTDSFQIKEGDTIDWKIY